MSESSQASQSSDGDVEAALHEALSALLHPALRGAPDTTMLRDEVCQYVELARERGDRVERVIVTLKEEIRAAARVGHYVSRAEQTLTERVVRWCIEEYYTPPAATDHERS